MKKLRKKIELLVKNVDLMELGLYQEAHRKYIYVLNNEKNGNLPYVFSKEKFDKDIAVCDEMQVKSKNLEWNTDRHLEKIKIISQAGFIKERMCTQSTVNYFAKVIEIVDSFHMGYKDIEYALKQLRELEISENSDWFFSEALVDIKNTFLNTAIEMNDLLDEPIFKLQQLKLIKKKKLINSAEFEILFSKSANTQRNYRNRIHDPLPYLGGGSGKDLMYDKKACQEWFKKHL